MIFKFFLKRVSKMRLVSLGSPPQYIKNWIKDHEEIDYLKIPFCIEALEDGNVKLVKTGSP